MIPTWVAIPMTAKEEYEMTAYEKFIRKLAFDWWNWDKKPPIEYVEDVMNYIRDHQKDFRGAEAQ